MIETGADPERAVIEIDEVFTADIGNDIQNKNMIEMDNWMSDK